MLKNLRTLRYVAALSAAVYAASLTAVADEPAENIPTEFYIYQLNDEGTEITGRAIALGTEIKRENDNCLGSKIVLPQGCKFIISTDGSAQSLELMDEGSRRYPAQADATMSMFENIKFESEPTDGCPLYFTAPTLEGDDSSTLDLVAFLARSDKDWSQGGIFKTKTVMMAPADLKLEIRQEGETDFHTVGDPIISQGIYYYHYTLPSEVKYEFAYSFGDGRYWCVATGGGQDKTTMISFDKPQEGRDLKVSTATTETDEWNNTSNLLFQLPATFNNGQKIEAKQPYEFIVDLNEMLGNEWSRHPIYINQWISGDMDADIILHADVTHQGTSTQVDVKGYYGYFAVPTSPSDDADTKNVHAFCFGLDYDLITALTQKEFFFDVLPKGETNTQNRDFTILPAIRQQQNVPIGYYNAIDGISYDNDSYRFSFDQFETGKKYLIFIEPTTNKVWINVRGTTTGVNDLEVADDEQSEPQYYDLQGRLIVNPAHGLYIRRQGRQVTKVVL